MGKEKIRRGGESKQQIKFKIPQAKEAKFHKFSTSWRSKPDQ